MKISKFMEEALFDDSKGYYKTTNPLGEKSDFITAPEISPVFGQLIAAYLLQITTEKQNKISLVEMGAGRGLMMRDILQIITKLAAKKIPQAVSFLEKTEFHIVEINPVLQKIQQKNLQDFKIKWHQKLPNFSNEILFISNELFDCFAIDQYVFTEIGWRERIIKDQKFTLANFDRKIHQFIEEKAGKFAPLGGVFEFSQTAQDFMNQLSKQIKNNGGIAINFDYGYLKNDFANTLQALKEHKKVDIFTKNCDLTAHVNFAALDQIAKRHQLNSSLITQKEFLTSLEIEERRKNMLIQNPKSADKINAAIDRLIKDDQMGQLFKCHIIWK